MASFFPSNIDPTLTRDQGNTPYNSHGQWQFGTANPSSNTHGGYSPDLSEVISNTSAKALEVNGHFIQIKMIANQRATEIEKLQETLASKTKENDQLTKENDHLNVEVKTLKEALGLFTKDYHNRQGGASGRFTSITSEILDLLAKQALRIRADNPTVVYWVKKEYTLQVKQKRGRPSQDSDDEEDHLTHFYLENWNGIPIDKSVIAEMSRKAQMLWCTLDKNGLAPETFGKIENRAWDYFSQTILADKAHEFLLLCDDREWKLQEWSTKSYPSWYRNRHLPPKTEAPKVSADLIKDSDPSSDKDENDLYKDDDDPSEGEPHSEDCDDNDPDGHTKSVDNPDSDAQGGSDDPEAGNSEQHAQNGDNDAGTKEDGPITGGTQSAPMLPVGPSTGISTASALVDPFAPTPSTSVRVIPSVGTSNAAKSTNIPTPATTTGFQVKLKVCAPSDPSSDAVDKDTPTLAPATHETMTTNGTDPTCVGNNAGPPPDTTPPNSHVTAKIGKKRKPEGSNTAPMTNKQQKVSNVLAIPTEGNSIRDICMCHWNEEQPRGHGPLLEFDVYFKSLSDADKEPFKKEQRITQATARKAKKKASDTPSAN
ncbi:hypothetical protein EDB84DRAFT_1559376 [Lactarius hengduanensis]|nr:hypothetical protein EDB84DRAFT_1559376 [Lactarius hengduanensis]